MTEYHAKCTKLHLLPGWYMRRQCGFVPSTPHARSRKQLNREASRCLRMIFKNIAVKCCMRQEYALFDVMGCGAERATTSFVERKSGQHESYFMVYSKKAQIEAQMLSTIEEATSSTLHISCQSKKRAVVIDVFG